MDNEYKCFWVSTCPYYESTTSYGKERIKCTNTNCIYHGMKEGEDESNDK